MTDKEERMAILFEYVMSTIVESEPDFSLAFIATTFDHICETHGLDKAETWEMLTTLAKQVNDERGPMYDPLQRV